MARDRDSRRSSSANLRWPHEKCKAEFTEFLTPSFHLATYSVGGSIHFQCMDWRHIEEMLAVGSAPYTRSLRSSALGGVGSSRSMSWSLFQVGYGGAVSNVELAKLELCRVNAFGPDRDDLDLHPTFKQAAMVMDAIRDCSHRKALVLDAFAGSGTTLIAAARTGRRGYGIEIDPAYCDVTIQRVRRVCGLSATLQATGQSFADVKRERSRSAQSSGS